MLPYNAGVPGNRGQSINLIIITEENVIMSKVISVVGAAAVIALGVFGVRKLVKGRTA